MQAYESITSAFRLIEVLAEERFLRVSQLVERTGLERRRVYRLLERFGDLGLTLERRGAAYRLSPDAPLMRKITERIHFGDSEIQTLAGLLGSITDNSPEVRQLREKVARLRDDNVFVPIHVDEHTRRNIETIFEAIRQERVAVLRNYRSNSGLPPKDRTVEPFQFLRGNRDVQCFEIESEYNKVFNLTRVEKVELTDRTWTHRTLHREAFTDLFHFIGTERIRVRLRLGVLSRNVLRDEYPEAEHHLSREDEHHWIFEDEVCSLLGIGRFVLGMSGDIDVIEPQALIDHLAEQADIAKKKWGKTSSEKN